LPGQKRERNSRKRARVYDTFNFFALELPLPSLQLQDGSFFTVPLARYLFENPRAITARLAAVRSDELARGYWLAYTRISERSDSVIVRKPILVTSVESGDEVLN